MVRILLFLATSLNLLAAGLDTNFLKLFKTGSEAEQFWSLCEKSSWGTACKVNALYFQGLGEDPPELKYLVKTNYVTSSKDFFKHCMIKDWGRRRCRQNTSFRRNVLFKEIMFYGWFDNCLHKGHRDCAELYKEAILTGVIVPDEMVDHRKATQGLATLKEFVKQRRLEKKEAEEKALFGAG